MNEVIVPGQIVWQSGVIGVAPYKAEPLARPCDTCSIEFDNRYCHKYCPTYQEWQKGVMPA